MKFLKSGDELTLVPWENGAEFVDELLNSPFKNPTHVIGLAANELAGVEVK